MKKVFKLSVFFLLSFTTIFSSLIVYLFVTTKNIKLDESKLIKSELNIVYYNANGQSISDFNAKSTVYEENIPSHVKNAFISVEDKRFYSHKGIDTKRLVGATVSNLKSLSFKEGASTITQQLIKNTHLTNKKTLKRKFAEIKLAIELEKKYSKDEIITLYLNTIYFGENCYGIKSASERYFGKDVSELSVNESAMLAGIVKAPSVYNPIENYDLAVKRKNLVLSLMRKNGFISTNQEQNCKNDTITVKQKSEFDAYYYQVKKELNQILNSPYINQKLSVYVYLDNDLQKYLTNIKTDVDTDKCFMVIDNDSMGVKAFYSTVSNAKRMPGSTVKPILVYTPCFEENIISPQTKILDSITDFNGYTPKNYNDVYYGYISAKEALSKSLNIPAVKLLDSLSVNKCKKYAKKMGIEIKNDNLGIALGGIDNGISFTKLASCYSMLAKGGVYSDCKFIKKIVNEHGKVIYENKPKNTKVFSEQACYLTTDCLKFAVKNGTSKKLSDKKYDLCAKTGTTGNEKGNTDAYSVSYTTKDTVLVWLGNGDNSYMSNKISGSTYPTAIASKIYDQLYTNIKPKNFSVPNGVIKVKIDRTTYEQTGELIASENDDYIEGLFIKGHEPKTKNTMSYPNIKVLKILNNNGDFTIFCSFENSDGYEIILNNKTIFDVKNEKFTTSLKCGYYSFILNPYRLVNGKKIYGEKIVLPQFNVTVTDKSIPNNWWE